MIDNQPLVSVLMTTFNHQEYVLDALKSIINQSYLNIEIIIADDCSTDETIAAINPLLAKHKNKITLIRQEKNIGPSKNFNSGLSRCKGDFVTFISGDDLFLPEKILTQVNYLNNNLSTMICYGDTEVFDSKTNSRLFLWSEKNKPRSGDGVLLIKYLSFMCGLGSCMVRYRDVKDVRFNEDVRNCGELLFLFEIVEKNGGKINFIEHVCYKYRRHESNMTNSNDHFFPEMEKTLLLMKSYNKYHFECSQMISQVNFIYAIQLLKKKNIFEFFCYLSKAIRLSKYFPFYIIKLIVKKLFIFRI
jgi:glycosyltransferase involved in cell wall biosynthesis